MDHERIQEEGVMVSVSVLTNAYGKGRLLFGNDVGNEIPGGCVFIQNIPSVLVMIITRFFRVMIHHFQHSTAIARNLFLPMRGGIESSIRFTNKKHSSLACLQSAG